MQNGIRAASVGAMLLAAGVLGLEASASPKEVPLRICPERTVTAGVSQEEVQQEEITLLKAQLARIDDTAYWGRAQVLGIAEAVKQSKLPERQQRRLAVAIVKEAETAKLDPLLVVAVIRAESSFDPYSISEVGARGLMQVMPATARGLAIESGTEFFKDSNLFDAEFNVGLGTRYLSSLITNFGSVEAALVAYNAGPSAAKKILKSKNRGAQFVAGYPTKVVREWKKLQAAYAVALSSS